MSYQDIAKLIPTVQAASLVGDNVKSMNKKHSTKDMVGLGVKNVVGTEMLKINAQLIGGL